MSPGMITGIVILIILLITALVLGLYFGLTSNGAEPTHTSLIPPSTLPPLPATEFFEIQYVNETNKDVTVWLEGSQPPCRYDIAQPCNTWLQGAETGADYTAKWQALQSTFAASGTVFRVGTVNAADDGWDFETVPVLNYVHLEPDQALLITTPQYQGNPDWSFSNSTGDAVLSPGVKAWVTTKGVNMYASERVLLYEYNIGETIWWDLSAVDGVNVQGTMQIGANLAQCAALIHDCLYPGEHTCQNLKFEPVETFNTVNVVQRDYPDIYNAMEAPEIGADNKTLAEAALGIPANKQGYHVYYSVDPTAVAYQNWLLRNNTDEITSNCYSWAYSEITWHPPDQAFDQNGDPTPNTGNEQNANRVDDFVPGTPIHIRVTDIID